MLTSTTVSNLAEYATYAVWGAAFVCSWKQWADWNAVAFTLGLLVIWPALAVTGAAQIGAETFPDSDPDPMSGGLFFLGMVAIAFAVCIAGWAIASVSGWLLRGWLARKHRPLADQPPLEAR